MQELIATLSMYDWPETRSSLDRFWRLISDELQEVGLSAPADLLHVEKQMPLWKSPDLVIGQTCGWPYANQLRGQVVPFARFDYGLDGCPAGYYRSVFIGRGAEEKRYIENGDGLADCPKIAINGDDSQSGFHVFSEISGKPASESIATQNRLITGSHRQSVAAVALGKASIAAIDRVAFELAKRHEPETAKNVSVIGYSIPKPGLPLITSLDREPDTDLMFRAITRALERLSDADKSTLMIRDLIPASDRDYDGFIAA